MSAFQQAEGIYNGTRSLHAAATKLYTLSKDIDELKKAIHRCRSDEERSRLTDHFQKTARKCASAFTEYVNHMRKINAHLAEIRKELTKL